VTAVVALAEAVRTAVAAVPDPEYPGVGIGELGMVEAVDADDDGRVEVVLVPTFLGCPALDLIRADVAAAARTVTGVRTVEVHWDKGAAWAPVRITPRGRRLLAEDLAVAVPTPSGAVRCPVCAAEGVEVVSEFGPSLCRRVARCPACRNPVEVVRG
jgi:ring-1,2-phenylacetyl-CoA epoxidase subunit PaaD